MEGGKGIGDWRLVFRYTLLNKAEMLVERSLHYTTRVAGKEQNRAELNSCQEIES
jgi:hypothetical protein